MLEPLSDLGFDIEVKNHADAILTQDFPDDLGAVIEILAAFRLNVAEIIGGGGGEAVFTQRLRRSLTEAGWPKHIFNVQTIVDGSEREAIGHEIDHVKNCKNGTLALEIEWNNKDPFYDRDLENFQRLHVISAISVGIIVTRGKSLQDAFLRRISSRLQNDGIFDEAGLEVYGITERTSAQRKAVAKMTERQVPFADAFSRNFVSSKFGQATTHWSKLRTRVDRGVGNPCPLLLIGLPEAILEG